MEGFLRFIVTHMKDIIALISNFIEEELEKEEYQQKVFQPLLQWFFRHILPYVIAIIVINFFMTIVAVSLVIYLRK